MGGLLGRNVSENAARLNQSKPDASPTAWGALRRVFATRLRGIGFQPGALELLCLVRKANGVGRPPAIELRRRRDREFFKTIELGRVGPAARRRARALSVALGREYPTSC